MSSRAVGDEVRVVGWRTGERPRSPESYPIAVWSTQDDAPVALTAVCGAIRRLLVGAARRRETQFRVAEETFTAPFGLNPRHYAEAFRIRPDNVLVPSAWDEQFPRIESRGRARLIIAGSRTFEDYDFLCARLERLCARFLPDRLLGISGGARGADALGERWCAERGVECVRYEAHWAWLDAPRAALGEHHGQRYNRTAGIDRNAKMAVAGTHLAAFVPGRELSPGTRSMVALAQAMGLAVRVASPAPRTP